MKWLINKKRWPRLGLWTVAVAGAQPVETEVEAEVRECCSTGLGNDWAVWKQDSRLAGLEG